MSDIILHTSPEGFNFLTEEQALTGSPFAGEIIDWVGRDGSIPVYDWKYPELGPGRVIERNGLVHPIIPIAGRNYLVTIACQTEDGKPTGARIHLLETTSPTTPATLMPEGSTVTRTSHLLGQPRFVQGNSFPMYGGKPAYVLAVLESGWGDCGNEIIWIGLGNDDRPTAAFHQADCA